MANALRASARAALALAITGMTALLVWASRTAPPTVRAGHTIEPEGEDTGSARVVGEREPNESPAAAQSLPAASVEVAASWQPLDRDVFRVVIDEPGSHLLRVWVDGPAGLRVAVGRDGRDVRAEAVSPARVATGVSRGVWLIAVDDGGDARAGSYRLHVATARWGRGTEWEPNDQPADASPLAALPATARTARRAGSTRAAGDVLAEHRARGWWSRPDDVDCFAVPLAVPPTGAVLRFELSPPPDAIATMWVLDAGDEAAEVAREVLATATSPAPGAAAVVPSVGGRSWQSSYVVCASAADGADPAAPYELRVRTTAPRDPFEFEPNGTRATASALPRDLAVTGHLAPGDTDVYRISAGGDRRLRVTVTSPRDARAALVLLDERGRELARAAAERPGQPIAVDGAEVVFAVVATEGPGDVDTTYRIQASASAAAPERAP